MSKLKFKLGKLTVDAQAYGSQGNAILGIRDSGKTYTATEIAEKLFEAGIPFITFDPTGVWRYLRVPGKGRGYPIVVAGGREGDLPLTVASAPEIVRAAMKNGVSLVLDLTDQKLSKADWRRIVKACVVILLQENAPHGLRHVFLEEAAEFIPQKVIDGDLYAEVEKLARIGGNSRLGFTIINQRSQEVAKAVLELCENLFLHRQKGKNAIENMDKWLDVADVAERNEIVKSLPRLPSGHCWAWMGGHEDIPTLIEVPPKNSFHPDRRVMHGTKTLRGKKRVDVAGFVSGMKSALVSLEAEFQQSDVPTLRKRIATLEADLKKLKATPTAAPIDKPAEKKAVADRLSKATIRGKIDGYGEAMKDIAGIFRDLAPTMAKLKPLIDAIDANGKLIEGWTARTKEKQTELSKQVPMQSGSPTEHPSAHTPMRAPVPAPPVKRPSPPANGDGSIGGAEQRVIDAIRWWNVIGIAAPSHAQTAFMAGYSHKSGTWATYLSRLRSKGLIEGRGDLVLTTEGGAIANEPDAPPTREALHSAVLGKIDAPLQKILTPLLNAYPDGLSHPDVAGAAGYSHQSGTWATYLSRLRSLDLISGRGELKAEPWLFAA